MKKDPILQQQDPLGTGILSPYAEGLKLAESSDVAVSELGERINSLFYSMNTDVTNNNRGYTICCNPITMIKGALFALGTKDLNNPEWKEQCSSSLREIFHVNTIQFFKKGYKEKCSKNNDAYLDRIELYYGFFTGFDHHEPVKWQSNIKPIMNDLNRKHSDGISDDEFIKIVAMFLRELELLFPKVNDKKKS